MNTAHQSGLTTETTISPIIVDHVRNPGTISKNLLRRSSLLIYYIQLFFYTLEQLIEKFLS